MQSRQDDRWILIRKDGVHNGHEFLGIWIKLPQRLQAGPPHSRVTVDKHRHQLRDSIVVEFSSVWWQIRAVVVCPNVANRCRCLRGYDWISILQKRQQGRHSRNRIFPNQADRPGCMPANTGVSVSSQADQFRKRRPPPAPQPANAVGCRNGCVGIGARSQLTPKCCE